MRKIIIPILLAVAVAACSNGTASNRGSNGSGSCSDGSGSSNDGAGRVDSAAGFSDAGAEQKKTAVDPGSVVFDAADSLEVEKLLTRSDCRTTLDYARYLLGRPYVAYTLEGAYQEGGDGVEKLVVNLREFDCLTLLETCNALALARAEMDLARRTSDAARGKQESESEEQASSGEQDAAWSIYCRNLASLRYFGGKIDGYISRLHYLSMSIADHLERGDMHEVLLPDELTQSRKTDIHFMSKHPQYYAALRDNSALQQQIAQLEAQYSGGTFRYLPQDKCGLSRQRLSNIHDGDIIYIVTDKDGLDYAHQGFAFWGNDGKLHMLHASSAKHKVIADPLSLEAYLRGIPSSIGIRVFRLSGIK